MGGIVIGCDFCHEPLEATALPFKSTTVLIYLHTRDITLLLLTTYSQIVHFHFVTSTNVIDRLKITLP